MFATGSLFRRLAILAVLLFLGASLLLWAFSWNNANQLRKDFINRRQQSVEAFLNDISGERWQNQKLLERSVEGLLKYDPNLALVELRESEGRSLWKSENTASPDIQSLLQIYGPKAVLARPLQDVISKQGGIIFPFLPKNTNGFIKSGNLPLETYYEIHSEQLNFLLADILADLLICAALILFLFVVFYLGIMYLLWPILSIKKAALAIAGGNLVKEVRVRRADELGTIATFFNEVVRNLNSVAKDLAYKDRVAHELELSSGIQQKLLPKKVPELNGIEIAARTLPAVEIGGDSYDFIPKENGNFMYIGDVTGHGIPAALVMTMMNVLLRAFSSVAKGPAELFYLVNQTIFPRIETNMFMTAAGLLWQENEQKLTYVNAGHEPPLIYRKTEKTSELVKVKGVALGMLPDNMAQLKETHIELIAGDILVLCSDGILEAKNRYKEEYGMDRLRQSLVRYGHRENLDSVIDGILKDLAEFTGRDKEWDDDVTLLLVQRTS